MKALFAVCILCLASVILSGCPPPEDHMYVEVIVTEDSPPVFRFGGDGNFEAPADVEYIHVYLNRPQDMHEFYWAIRAHRPGGGFGYDIPLREVVYGVIPDGFKESVKAVPLEPGGEYLMQIYGGYGVKVEFCFAYKPGRYYGSGSNIPSAVK